MKPIQILLSMLIGYALGRVIVRYRQHTMRTWQFLFWLAVWTAAIAGVWLPNATNVTAHLVGVGRGADLIVYTALAVAFYLIFQVTLSLERLEQGLTEVVRHLALERTPELNEPQAGSPAEPDDRATPSSGTRRAA